MLASSKGGYLRSGFEEKLKRSRGDIDKFLGLRASKQGL